MAQSGVYRTNMAGPIFLGICAGFAALGVLWTTGFILIAPAGMAQGAILRFDTGDWWRITLSWFCSVLPFGDRLSNGLGVVSWREIAGPLAAVDVIEPFVTRIKVAVFGSLATGAFVVILKAKTAGRHRVGWRHVRGRQLREGHDAVTFANMEFRRDIVPKVNPPALFLAPGVQMDLSRETETFLFLGAPGSGKTQWFRFLFQQIIERGDLSARAIAAGATLDDLQTHPDKIIGLDVKGDVCERWPNDDFMLMAPHDVGLRKGPGGQYAVGVAWDVGRDIVGPPAAKDLAVQVIAESTDPIWADAAREILTGFIIGLQISMGVEWGWSDLRSVMEWPAKRQKEFLTKYYPVAAGYFILTKAGPNRTTASYLANINAKVYPLVLALALGWGECKTGERISLREWVLNLNPQRRVLLLQMSGNVQAVSAAWIRAVISFMAAFVKSPEVPESTKRRVWWGLDEFPQVAQEGDGFLQVIEVGRSKGFCAVVGAQVKSQFEESWSEAQMHTLEAMTRTPLVFRTGAGSIAQYLAETVVGWVEYRARDHSVSVGADTSRSYSTSIERELTVQPNYFQSGLGKFKRGLSVRRGVYALYVGARDACRLEIPFSSWTIRRDGIVLAEWVFDARTLQRSASESDIENMMLPSADGEEDEAAVGSGTLHAVAPSSLFSGGMDAGRTVLSRLQVQDPDLFNRIMSRAAGSGSPGGTDGEDAAGEDEDD